MVTMEILNVSLIEPRLKHPTIFKHFDDLEPGEGFIIDNDHDPKPLYYQLLGERGNIFTWEYLMEGPQRWQVRISKNPVGAPEEEIGTKDSRKAEVFKAKGLDYSCNENKASGDTDNRSEALSENKEPEKAVDFKAWPVGRLTDFIADTYHRYIRNNTEIVKGVVQEVAEHHGNDHPELIRLQQGLPLFLQHFLTLVTKEETVIFPAMKACDPAVQPGVPPAVSSFINLLQKDHALLKEDLDYFRRLTNNYLLPADACNSYAYLYQKLSDMDNRLKEYMELERNVLFPKVTAAA